MLQIHSFTFNPFQENTYLIVAPNKNTIIVDPGMYDATEAQVLFSYVEQHNLIPQKVLLTHAHLDHVFGLKAVVDKYDLPFYLHEKELPVYTNAEGVANSYGVQLSLPEKRYQLISENEVVNFEGEQIEIRFAPGHSPGSICFYYSAGNWVIGGDVLFQNSIGRTDLPGGDTATLLQSVQTQLFTLAPETVVHAGHGPSTTVGLEKMNNPFFRG